MFTQVFVFRKTGKPGSFGASGRMTGSTLHFSKQIRPEMLPSPRVPKVQYLRARRIPQRSRCSVSPSEAMPPAASRHPLSCHLPLVTCDPENHSSGVFLLASAASFFQNTFTYSDEAPLSKL
jgi:hypothetical protein